MTDDHPDSAAFWAAIGAAPDDQLRRLVFADWLEENNHDGGPCVACDGHGLIDGYGRGAGEGVVCVQCRGFGEFIPDGRADLAAALRATADRVPVHYCGLVWTWWRSRSGACDIPADVYAVLQPARVVGATGGLSDYPTVTEAIRDLCRAWIVVHKQQVTA